jgi:hypothetical protein
MPSDAKKINLSLKGVVAASALGASATPAVNQIEEEINKTGSRGNKTRLRLEDIDMCMIRSPL